MHNYLTVFRTNISPYQGESFKNLERQKLSAINNIKYLATEKNQIPDILLTNTHAITTTNKIENVFSDRIKLIVHPNSGYDNFCFDFVKNAKFPIIIGNPIRSHAVSNYILSALISHYSPLPIHKVWNKNRLWNRGLLSEKNVLIIGYGHIGQILDSALRPLVKNIKIYDPFKGKEKLDLQDVDIVIPAASLNPTSRSLIDKDFISKLKDDFLIINAARGSIINQEDLKYALKSMPQSFAYLDVFEKEPLPDNTFNEIDNIRTTSHIAGVYKNLNSEIINFEYKILREFIKYQNDIETFNHKFSNLLLNNRVKESYLI